LVLLIWGLIFYKIFAHVGDDGGIVSHGVQNTAKKVNPKDTFTILANYRDPFLDHNYRPIIQRTGADHVLEPKGVSQKSNPVIENIPDIKYFGLIANPKSKRKVGLFKMSNKDLLLKEGDAFNDLIIARLFNDSVMITFHKSKKTIKKNSNKI
jgi:hypothetical protein